MTEQISTQGGVQANTEPSAQEGDEPSDRMSIPEPPSRTLDAALLALLIVNGALLGAFGLVFTPMYVGGVPVPMGIVLSVLLLPWLVARAGEVDTRPAVAGSPLIAWVVVVIALGLFGPGGDIMLPPTVLSLLLLVGGIGAGLWALRRVIERSTRG
jgi:hypothetical protein